MLAVTSLHRRIISAVKLVLLCLGVRYFLIQGLRLSCKEEVENEQAFEVPSEHP